MRNSNSKLKPCPFCGSAVNILYNSKFDIFYVFHADDDCKFNSFQINGCWADSLKEAYDIWNTRKD